ncbi:hypothetical protein BH11PSE5_BH11PSE5_30850 [soil metagenome]
MAKLTNMGSRLGGMPSRIQRMPKLAEDFYTSPEWRALVATRKRDPDYKAAVNRARAGERVILDHVTERKDGGADLDPANTKWLTNTEHQAKTAEARRLRALGRV